MIKLFCVLSFMLFGNLAWSQYRGGNGGEGVILGSDLYLRDLFERDIHQKIFRGSEIREPMKTLAANFTKLPLTEEQRQLLAIKLTDAENLYPCFGELLGKALGMYDWILANEELSLLPQDGMIRILPESMRVQLANRIGSSIHVHKDSWLKLNDENKVALLIHEAAYALTKLDPHSKRQAPFFSMEVTALIFSSDLRTIATTELISTLLGLGRDETRHAGFCADRKARTEVQWEQPGEPPESVAQIESAEIYPAIADQEIEKVCQNALQRDRPKTWFPWGISVVFRRYDPLDLEFQKYRTRDGGIQLMLGIKGAFDREFGEKFFELKNQRQCVRDIRSHLETVKTTPAGYSLQD